MSEENKGIKGKKKQATNKFSLRDWKKKYATAATLEEKQTLKKELTLSAFNDVYENHHKQD